MAILIPAIGACVSRMTNGERRLAVICRHYAAMDECGRRYATASCRTRCAKARAASAPNADTIKALEFPVLALMGVGQMPAEGEDEREEARLFYVGATRTTQRLAIAARRDGGLGTICKLGITLFEHERFQADDRYAADTPIAP